MSRYRIMIECLSDAGNREVLIILNEQGIDTVE